ncbi:MAG TPA: glycosyltransferase [Acidocella sp.]|nr:MAG: hypothetical protein B7Z80_00635 [Rhodospirillales bacterium 20-64-7]HQT46006.1 glycosyltransferase [Acidocella sp.]
MTIKGQVDGMEGGYVVGWAVAEPDAGSCTITLCDAGGTEVARGSASRHRADLAALGLGRTTLAFRIKISLSNKPSVIHVKADGEALPGSPISTGKGKFDGHCVLDGSSVIGWVTERVSKFKQPEITIVDQYGHIVGQGACHPAPTPLDSAFSPGRFSIALADRCFGAGELALTVCANGVKFSALECNLRLEGNLELISSASVQGWLASPHAPARKFGIEIFRNGLRVGDGECEFTREDVRQVIPGCVTPGFAITLLPLPEADDAQPVAISLRLAGSDRELFQGPYLVASRAAAVDAVHRIGRLAHAKLPGIGIAEQAVLQEALVAYLEKLRQEDGLVATRQKFSNSPITQTRRMMILIPVYRDVAVTCACIESVLLHRDADIDQLLIINDASPEEEMASRLAYFATLPNVFLLTNPENLGFVKTINRGLSFSANTDILLLNSDTVVHQHGLDELHRIAAENPEIGTVTAISNNATIFSYPHAQARREKLNDISWSDLAAAALCVNAGAFVDVPTGHGFCMLIKAEVLRRVGPLDEAFGRGYGEENDFCARAAALGYRNVAAAGVFVEHRESMSFAHEKASLLAQNLPRLNRLYPEYTPLIMAFEHEDGLRRARWGLDRVRMVRATHAGQRFVLVIRNALEGGTARAIEDIERTIGHGGATAMSLSCTENGLIELACEAPLIRASFADGELDELFALLDAAAPGHVMVHQLLGYKPGFIRRLGPWAAERHSVFFAHDFYSFCPRVTMIDAVGRFCDVAEADTCARCIALEGAHAASRMVALTPAEHRECFAAFFGHLRHVVAPSTNAAGYLRRAFTGMDIEVVPHPEQPGSLPATPRSGDDNEIVLLGAIGPHKGSRQLLDLARLARLTHPRLRFRVIGYTDIDKPLTATGNVTITGKFAAEELPKRLQEARGRLALFLPNWPETYSYTLSEVVRFGFIPVVPDIGAMADRVRMAGYGVIFPFQAPPAAVLDLLDGIATGRAAAFEPGTGPAAFFPHTHINALTALLGQDLADAGPPMAVG